MESAATVPHKGMPSRRPTSWLFLLILGGGFLLRLRLAWLTFLNPDEALHYFLAHQASLKIAYEASLTTAHPPLMILFLHYWCLLGRSELFLRLPFVIAGTLFCWVMFLWTRKVAGSTAACFALAMFLFAPSLISLSAEIRQYSFLLLFCACSLYWLELALEKGEKSVQSMIFSAAALYLALLTHYSAMIFAAAVGLYGLLSLIRQKSHARLTSSWILSQAGALAICAFLYQSQISKLRESGVPSEIASTWLKYSIFQPGQNHLMPFAWHNSLRLFRYFFSQGTVGVIGFALFVFAVVVLILANKSYEPDLRKRELAALIAIPFLITLVLAIAGIYPFGGTRHDALLTIFAISGISIGLDLLPLGGTNATTKFVKAILLASALLICNLHPSPSGPYMRPQNQRRELMHQAVNSLKSLPPESVLFTDAQGSTVLDYYLCGDAMPLPFTPQKQIQRRRCGQYYVLASMAEQTGFDRAAFPQLLTNAWQEVPDGSHLYLFQSGWIDDRQQDWLNELRALGGTPNSFGPNILICPIQRTNTTPANSSR
ncbi:MAG TPA: glycosyltransferase family 39 protein [Terriglobales bacterium]|jgi:4-amino-4-deoxy-L-arabinose transferase-like glycosyltransferase|nr:glycosyltransferase family 39 protein [Terriglobales bacterium]